MISVNHLSISYPSHSSILNDVSFSLENGESVALMGANGCGKTSLLLAMCGLLPFEGNITVGGISLSSGTRKKVQQKIGYIFQNPDEQLFCPTIREDIAFGLQNLGFPNAQIQAETEHWLDAFGLKACAERSALMLSGGEKRMASLAAVLSMSPEILLLDEPTSFLDRKARMQFEAVLQSLKQTKLIATHDTAFASRMCSRVILIRDGRVEADGPCVTLFHDAALMDKCGVDPL